MSHPNWGYMPPCNKKQQRTNRQSSPLQVNYKNQKKSKAHNSKLKEKNRK